ncbi:MAG: alanine racemase C-terminal domain-containing protein [Pseudomonadota bacterium]
MTLSAPILQVRQIETGETVGYGATWRAGKPTLVATLALGYGDGFPRSASNKGFASSENFAALFSAGFPWI